MRAPVHPESGEGGYEEERASGGADDGAKARLAAMARCPELVYFHRDVRVILDGGSGMKLRPPSLSLRCA